MELVWMWMWCVMVLVGTSTATLTPCPLPSPGGAGHWSVLVAASPHQPRPVELKVRVEPTPERVETSIGQLTFQKLNGEYVAIIPSNLTLAHDIYIFITYKDLKTKPLLKYLEINNIRLCYSESMETHKHLGGESYINNVVKDYVSQEVMQEIPKIAADRSNINLSIQNGNSTNRLSAKSKSRIISPLPEKTKNDSIVNAEKTYIKSDFPKYFNRSNTQSNSENISLRKYTLDQNITNDIVANVSDIVMDKVVKMIHQNMKNCCKGMKNSTSLANTTQRSITNTTNVAKIRPTNAKIQTSFVTQLPSSTANPAAYNNTTIPPQNKINLSTGVIFKYSLKNVSVTTAKPMNTTTNLKKRLLQIPQSDKFTNKRLLVNHMQSINISTEAPKHSKQNFNISASEIHLGNKNDANVTSDSVMSAELKTYVKENNNRKITDGKKLLQNVTKTNDGYVVLNLKLVKPLLNLEKDNEVQVYKKIKEMESDLERLDKEIMLRYVESDPDQDAMRKMEMDMDKFFSVNNLRKALSEDAQFETPTTEDYLTSLETTIPTTYFGMLR